MYDADSQLLDFLARCRRRLLLLEGGRALAWAGLTGLLALVAALLLRQQLAGGMLRLLLGAGLVAGGLLAAGLAGWAWWRRGRPEALVRLVERLSRPAQSLELVAAWQFARGGATPGPGTSLELARAHVERLAGELAGTSPRRLLPARPLLAPLAALAAAALVLLGLVVTQPQAVDELAARLAAATANEPAAAGPPWVGDISLRLYPPAYSGRAGKLVEGSDGSVVALPGTRVVLEARADRAVTAGELRFGQGRVPLAVSDSNHLRAEFLVERSDHYRFSLQSQDGDSWLDERPRPVVAESDLPPELSLLEPGRDLVVKPDQVLRLHYQARDDFGLEQVRLHWRRAGGLEQAAQRVLKRPRGRRRLVGSADFDLAPLHLEPGERLQLYIEALDNDSVNGPKSGRSEVRQLEVYSSQKQHQQLMQHVEQAWEQLLGHLAAALEQEPEARDESRPPATVTEVSRLLAESRPLAASLRQLAAALATDPLASEGLAAALDQVGRHLEWLDQSLEHLLARDDSPPGQPAGARLRAHRAARISRLEHDVLYLEDLLDLARLDEIDRLAERLGRLRGRLAELLERYARAPDEATRRQIEAEIARLKETIAELLERQRNVLKGVRDEYLNPEALAKLLGDRDMLGALDRLQRMLNQGRMEEALAQLERLGGQLRDLQAALEQSRRQLGAGRNAELARQLGQALAELEQITAAQRRLQEQSGKLQQQLLQRFRRQLSGQLDRLLERLAEQARQVDRRLQQLATPGRPQLLEQLEARRAREQVKLLELALQQQDLGESRRAAERLVQNTTRLVEQAEMRQQFLSPGPGARQQRRRRQAERRSRLAGQAHRLARGILEQLEQLVPDARRLLGGRQRRQLQGQARQQAELGGRLAQLQQQLQRLDQQAPLFGPSMLGRLARGRHHMQGATRHLRQGRPDEAQPRQRQALAELEALQQAMQKSCRSGRAGGMPLPLGSVGRAGGRDLGLAGGRPLERDVELPDPEDFQPPRDYRRQLLEGMKDPVPEQYRQQVRDYYQELVK